MKKSKWCHFLQAYDEHKFVWVALDENNSIITYGDNLKDVLTRAKEKGFDDPVLTKYPQNEDGTIEKYKKCEIKDAHNNKKTKKI